MVWSTFFGATTSQTSKRLEFLVSGFETKSRDGSAEDAVVIVRDDVCDDGYYDVCGTNEYLR